MKTKIFFLHNVLLTIVHFEVLFVVALDRRIVTALLDEVILSREGGTFLRDFMDATIPYRVHPYFSFPLFCRPSQPHQHSAINHPKMKRSFEAMQASAMASKADRSVSFALFEVVYMVDCSETTKDLFYGKRDFSRFQTEHLTEEKELGNLRDLKQRKRRQQDYQLDTLAEIRRRRIENRILDIIQGGERQQATNTERSDICFQMCCIPLRQVSMHAPRSHHSQMANAA